MYISKFKIHSSNINNPYIPKEDENYMEPREKRLLEVVLGSVLVIILILASVMVVSASKGSETETTITNSYNTYNYNINAIPSRSYVESSYNGKPYYIDETFKDYDDDYRINRIYYDDDWNEDDGEKEFKEEERHLRYSDEGNLKVAKGIVGNRINNYEAYVSNKDYVGGYFKVVFYFEDYY